MAKRIPYDTCPLCDCLELTEVGRGDVTRHPLYRADVPATIRWIRCKGCDHVFTDGYFSEQTFATIFEKAIASQQVGFEPEKQRYVAGQIIERVTRYVPPSGCWLDIGFGSGALLLTAQEFGFRPLGLDLRSNSVAALRRIGIEAHCCDLLAFKPDYFVDVISMADVLEHMPFPRPALDAAHRLLRPQGVLFVSMPNKDAPVWKMLDKAKCNPYWQEIEHFHNFGRTRLYALLKQHGFDPVHYAVSQRYRLGMEVIAIRSG